jgi:CxxC motif-containing protein (DUF1111 family)
MNHARSIAFIALGLFCLAEVGCVRRSEPGDPLPGLADDQLDLFEQGRIEFERVFTPETGLGPLFNAESCGECHEDPVAGGSGDEVEVHVSAFLSGGVCDPLLAEGGPVIQQRVTAALKAALGIDSEPVPAKATGRAGRTTPDIFGFGLLDAVPEAEILALADPDDRDNDGISGRPNRFPDGRLGRFGRKAFIPTLREFNEGAFLIEQGITSPADPAEGTIGGKPIPLGADPSPDPEIDQKTLDLTDAFVRFLAPPEPKKLTRTAKHGREVFSRIGCDSCHVPKLKTGDHPVQALKHKEVAAYSDLLLHDMGPTLADICLGLATPAEFRTEPLMGLRHMPHFLHDGRAGTIEQAIELHGGEGLAARDQFQYLPQEERAALLEFLNSL